VNASNANGSNVSNDSNASNDSRRRLLGPWGATAMIVAEVVGVGIFLTPAAMMRALGTLERALVLWGTMGALTFAGALCYAELSTRFPRAGGTYVYLKEAFGTRCAFVYGWMSLLVMDPGLTAALALGGAQYLLAALGADASTVTPLAIALIVGFAGLTLAGVEVSARVMRWTATAKLAAVALLVASAVLRWWQGTTATALAAPPLSAGVVAPAVIAAFFAFGGWWDLGRMSEEVDAPRRTLPRAMLGGVTLVAAIYALISVALILGGPGGNLGSDEALVTLTGSRLFGAAASRLLALVVITAVAGSLAAVLLGAPRVYLAMARDGLFSSRLLQFNERRGTAPGGTLIQASLASLLVVLGNFNEILGFFVPGAVFFLGLSAAAVLVLPRPAATDARVFRAPLHPLPIVFFLLLIVAMLVLFIAGQPRETAIGAAIIALGIPASYFVVRRVTAGSSLL
jgi:basic amino acid/polyamine antiporter, APA family